MMMNIVVKLGVNLLMFKSVWLYYFIEYLGDISVTISPKHFRLVYVSGILKSFYARVQNSLATI